MSMTLAITLVVWLGGGLVALRHPGAGLAVALLLGRHTFPDREDPLLYGGLLILLIAFAAAYWRRVPVKVTWPAIAIGVAIFPAALLYALDLSVVNYNGYGTSKLLLLAFYVLPATLGASLLRDIRFRQEFAAFTVSAAFGLSVIALSGDGGARARALGGGPITLGVIVSLAILICVALAARIEGSDWHTLPKWLQARWIWLAPLPVLGLALVNTGSRGPVLALAAASLFLVVSVFRQSRRAGLYMTGLIGVATALIVPLLQQDHRFALLGNPEEEFSRSRGFHAETGWADFIANPVFGNGPGSFGYSAGMQPSERYAHNVLLESGSEFGILMLLAVLLTVIVSLFIAWRSRQWVLGAMLLYSFAVAQVSGDLVNSRYVFFFCAAVVAIASARHMGVRTATEVPAFDIGTRSARVGSA